MSSNGEYDRGRESSSGVEKHRESNDDEQRMKVYKEEEEKIWPSFYPCSIRGQFREARGISAV
jgi:hypothetical protein